jgi:hypothetical protein
MYWAQTPGTPYYFFKGVNVIPAPVKVVEEAMRQIENMKVCVSHQHLCLAAIIM